ncbi:hypothetical protein M1555_01595 [Patescibacteria group bacterium]|nr:hypothetical protein [Patescibacteria group bacterium]
MTHTSFRRLLLQGTEGVLSATTDLLLLILFYSLNVAGTRSSYDIYRAGEEASSVLDEINYKSIKNALYALTKNGYIERSPKHSAAELAITGLGLKRIRELTPTYHKKRPWDNQIYLISYDIPTKTNHARACLRNYIRKTGGALLQESLWINPYNPTVLIEAFIHEHHIPGAVLVSRLGPGGSIGNETIPRLVRRVYRLDLLHDRYNAFIRRYSERTLPLAKTKLFVDYSAILRDDPQLPFALLPDKFAGENAQTLYSRLMNL